MAEVLSGSGTPAAGTATDSIAPPPVPQYIPYRPPGSEYTPPASPQPSSPHVGGLASRISKRPANLRMDYAPPAYERPVYSPSPSSSPPLPPTIPSPHFPPRQRAPSLLRHAAVSSPLNEGFPRAEQPLGSPTFVPMKRQASGPGPTSDARTIFNPLASNPVNHSGPAWRLSREDVPPIPQQRPRGLTSSSQPGFHPPLRAATSIPDYGQYRAVGRPNPSGAYRPDRGGANWSHNDHFPAPPFRHEESRASFRSAWTNASSSFVDISGTERSSMVTGRSSISASDNRTSIYSTAQSGDGDFGDPSEDPSVEDDFMSVEDVIDSYCYDDDEDISRQNSSVLDASDDSEVPGLSQTNSQSDNGSSRLTPEPFNGLDTPQPGGGHSKSYFEVKDSDGSSRMQEDVEVSPKNRDPLLRLSALNLASVTSTTHTDDHVQQSKPDVQRPQRQLFGEIYNDLRDLPSLPKDKSRLSRQDWAGIQAYARKHSRGSSQVLEQGSALSPSPSMRRPALVAHGPPPNSSPLPEVDEDEAYPRRASTSVFDRRSTLFELTKALSASPPPASREPHQRAAEEVRAKENRQSGQIITNPPQSPSTRADTNHRHMLRPQLSLEERDRYGFKKATDKISVQQYDEWYNTYEMYVARRRGKWVALMEKQNLPITDPVKFPEHCEKVRRYCRKGFPPEWRGAMWWFYSNGQKKLEQMPGLYASLVARVRQGELNKDDREAIERDLDRTFPDNIHFRPDPTPEDPEREGQAEPHIVQDLREVLQCFALNNPGIGYCQSLNFIAGLLLLFMRQDTEKVFILLTIITQYHLPGAHARSLANTEVNVLMMLIKDYLPKVWASINDTDLVNNGLGSHVHPDSKYQRQPTVALSCTSWFMSLFVGVLPIEVVLRVWDAFLYEGPRALFRYALAIFKLGEPEIRRFHPGDGELFMTVQNLPRKCLDPNVLHDIAFVKRGFGSLTQDIIDQKRQFWQQQLSRDKRKEVPALPRYSQDPFRAVVEAAASEEKRRVGLRRRASASRRFFKRERS